MPSMNLVINHTLGAEEARRRLESVLPGLKARYAGVLSELEERWTGNTNDFAFKAMGMKIYRVFEVNP